MIDAAKYSLPDDPIFSAIALIRAASIERNLGQTESSCSLASAARMRWPNPATCFEEGLAMVSNGHSAEGLRLIAEAVENEPLFLAVAAFEPELVCESEQIYQFLQANLRNMESMYSRLRLLVTSCCQVLQSNSELFQYDSNLKLVDWWQGDLPLSRNFFELTRTLRQLTNQLPEEIASIERTFDSRATRLRQDLGWKIKFTKINREYPKISGALKGWIAWNLFLLACLALVGLLGGLNREFWFYVVVLSIPIAFSINGVLGWRSSVQQWKNDRAKEASEIEEIRRKLDRLRQDEAPVRLCFEACRRELALGQKWQEGGGKPWH